MSATRPEGPASPTERSRKTPRLSKAACLGLGLILTLAGLFLLALLFPVAPGDLARLLPVGAAGIVALWLGGILLGTARRG